ncbi:hypothetical protein WR25_26760 [Diploscapter pachys]|uniref:Glutathione S-transferase kappa n=1 Tax=Diploscapter pachys TaxID=2018661 RepID=A0A2A2JN49_9BILA|nr:hypothetical protein WR25_26760 [Diploscapter pachys]
MDVWDIELKLKPFDLRAIMKATGNQPPERVMAKGLYIMKDLQKNVEFWKMPISGEFWKTQTDAPNEVMKWVKKYNTRDVSKLIIASKGKAIPLARELWTQLWSRGQKIFEDADLKEVLKKIGVTNEDQLLKESKDPKIAQELENNTQDAIEQGAFGAPWIVVHKDGEDHYFFGSDRFPLIAQLIGKPFSVPLPSKI